MSIIDLLPSGQKNSASTLMENWQQSPSRASNPFWATTSQMAQTVLPTHIRSLQLRGRRGRRLRKKASVSHPGMYCPRRKPLKGGRALGEVYAGDYNFSCAPMIRRVRTWKNNKILRQPGRATPHECLPGTRNRTGSTSCQKRGDGDIFIRYTETSNLGTYNQLHAKT